ncbi:MAG: acyltransferase domain-containing protein, partial [Elusimicrobia bacterium]|nr:acyltransferase domain-containing protein [Elusimicrobiota bacterium]
SPTGDIRPFDAGADGTLLGEGLGMVVLKRLDDAERDGDRVYAVIKGVGSSSDGRGKSIYAPSAEGQAQALRAAYAAAGVEPSSVGLVEAHGTGTAAGDAAEVAALAEVFRRGAGRPGRWCALGSVKSQIGHAKAAAGAAGLIKAALSLHHKVLPPTIKVSRPNPVLADPDSPFYLNTEKRPWLADGPRRAAVSAMGFGGSNFHVVLEEHDPAKARADWDGRTEIAAFSGPDREALRRALAESGAAADWEEARALAAASRAAFDPAAAARLCLVLDQKEGWARPRQAALEALARPEGARFPDGIFFGAGKPGELAVLFPGQGSQYLGMGRDLACQFPEAFNVLAAADRAFGGGLGDLIHPRPAFTPEEQAARQAALRDTRAAQPALGAADLAAWRVLESFGVKADAFAGHSYGELVALCAAGRYDEATLHQLSVLRGKAMAEAAGDGGGMLAVSAPLGELERLLAEEGLRLVVANKNAPEQSVLSGPKDEIRRAVEALARRRLRGVELQVSAAFHSPMVEAAQKAFRTAIKKLGLRKSDVPVYANKTAGLYPDSAQSACDLLAGQLSAPVEFVSLVENMHAAGARVFLEAGPGGKLTGLVSAILKGRQFRALCVDASAGRRDGVSDLGRTLAELAALGFPVRLARWQGAAAARKPKPKFSVKLCGANYRTQRPAEHIPAPRPPRADAPSADPAALSALQSAQESMKALEKLQQQTAELHARFLSGQEAIQRSFQSLVEQQQAAAGRGTPAVLPSLEPPARPAAEIRREPPPAAPAAVAKGVLAALTAVVCEKTGYPAESLNADMDLEADLGIDSIKRVEILSAVQEKLPGAPRVKPEHLGTLRTLRQVAQYLGEGQAQGAGPAVPAPAPAAPAGNVLAALTAVVCEKTGYPAESLNADMDLEADLGIDSIKRV